MNNNSVSKFIWNDDVLKINPLFESLIGKNQLKALKENPPVVFPETNLSWLGKFTKLGSTHTEIAHRLKEEFSYFFNHIRFYHACCPMSVNDYYAQGFKPLDIIEQQELFKEIFSPYISEEYLFRAITATNEDFSEIQKYNYMEERKKIFFPLDKKYIDEYCGEFMLGGEYWRTLVTRLYGIDNILKEKISLFKRIPTVFIVDIPLEIISEDSLLWIVGNIACKWVCEVLKKEPYNTTLMGAISFPELAPQYINGHYHLEKIEKMNSFVTKPGKLLEAYCDKCQAKKKISYSI